MHKFGSSLPSLPSLSPHLSPGPLGKRFSEPEPEALSMQQSFRNLSLTKSQLQLLLQALGTVSQEKKTLTDATSRLKKRKGELISDCLNLKKNHDRLHNETVKLDKAHAKFESDRATMEKELETLVADGKQLDVEIAQAKLELMQVRAMSNEETASVQKLNDMIARLKRELALQVRQRETARSEGVSFDRQIAQIREKIYRMQSSNQSAMRQIKKTAHDFGATHHG